MAFEAENIRDWLGRKIVDPPGSTICDMEAVYYDSHYAIDDGPRTGRRLARR